jgi:hypothetical protein
MTNCSCGYEMVAVDGVYECQHCDWPCGERDCIECKRYNAGQARKRATS